MGETTIADWKASGPDELVVKAPPGKAKPGPLTLLVKTFGDPKAEALPVRTFAEPSHLERFTIHAGDPFGELGGSRLGEVDSLTLMGVDYRRDPFAPPSTGDVVPLYATTGRPDDRMQPGATAEAKVTLTDGRTLDVDVAVVAPRPRVTLIAKSVQPGPSNPRSGIQLTDADAVARNAVLTFSVRSEVPPSFSGREEIQVATPHGAFMTTLTLSDGLTLEDSRVAIATLDTGKAFVSSAGGPLRYRIVEDGVAGDWQPLATLVRLPIFRELKCPPEPARACKLTGANLFLLDALSNDPAFAHAIRVPAGFAGTVLAVPRPTEGKLFVKLRDDPSAVNPVALPLKASTATPDGARTAQVQPPTSTAGAAPF
jgi:hypothetical protein